MGVVDVWRLRVDPIWSDRELRAFIRTSESMIRRRLVSDTVTSASLRRHFHALLARRARQTVGTSKDVARIAGVSDRAVRKARACGRLTGQWTGKEWLYSRCDVESWTARRLSSAHSLRYMCRDRDPDTGGLLKWMAIKAQAATLIMRTDSLTIAEQHVLVEAVQALPDRDYSSLISLTSLAAEILNGSSRLRIPRPLREAGDTWEERFCVAVVCTVPVGHLDAFLARARQQLANMRAAPIQAAAHLKEVSLA